MKKRILFLAFLMLTFVFCCAVAEEEGVRIDEEHFPDKAFRNAIRKYDLNYDDVLSDEEAENALYIDVGMKGIKTLKGIEYLTQLEKLKCLGNELTDLDVSKNTKLKELDCAHNYIKELDLSRNEKLEILCCAWNQLTELDISNNVELRDLSLPRNQLTELDVSRNIKLTELNCSSNKIKNLDISMLTKMTELIISGCSVKNPDFSIYSNLEWLVCAECELTELDVSHNLKLERLHCEGNQLTKLDLSNNPDLQGLSCEENRLTELDVSNNTGLELLCCGENHLTKLDVSNNPKLTTLSCEENQLTELDISNNPWIRYLTCYGNEMETLDISNCMELLNTVRNTEASEENGILKWKTLINIDDQRTELSVDKTMKIYKGIEDESQQTELINGISGDALVYYVPDGGQYYHLNPECFFGTSLRYCCTYAELEKEQYCYLLPCEGCSAPLERIEDTPYDSFGDAEAVSVGGRCSYNNDYCVTCVERDGFFYRVVAVIDEEGKKLFMKSMATRQEENMTEYRPNINQFFDYCKTLPVRYEEKITAASIEQEELDAFVGKTLRDVFSDGFVLDGHCFEYARDVIFSMEKGLYEYRFIIDASEEKYQEHVNDGYFDDLIVMRVENNGLSHRANDMQFRADGTVIPNDRGWGELLDDEIPIEQDLPGREDG